MMLEPLEHRQLLSATINEFPVPSATSAPRNMVAGPGGNLWFSDAVSFEVSPTGRAIDEMNLATHAVNQLPIPTTDDIAIMGSAVADGNVWFNGFTQDNSLKNEGAILEVNPATHAFTYFVLPSAEFPDPYGPSEIVAGRQGKVWFLDDSFYSGDVAAVGEIDTSTQAVNAFPLPLGGAGPLGLAVDQAGDAWFSEGNSTESDIAEINGATNAITQFKIPSQADYLVSGPDGNIYFTDKAGVGEINVTTDAVSQFDAPTGYLPTTGNMIVGGDGNLWFVNTNAQTNSGELATLDLKTDQISEVASRGAGYSDLTWGPDGNIWWFSGASQLSDLNTATNDVSSYTIPNSITSRFPVSGPDGNLWFGYDTGAGGGIAQAVLNSAAAGAQIEVGASPNPALTGQTVTLTATVTASRQTNAPSGTVTFYDGAVQSADELGTGALAVIAGQAQATFQTSALAMGAHSIIAVYQGDGNFQGGQSTALGLTVNPDRNALYVTAVYQDVLRRAPDPKGLAYWTQKLDSGAPRGSVANLIGKSDEYYQNFVIKPDYLKILGRAADDKGLSYWTTKMDSGATDQQLEAELAASDEVYAAAGGKNVAWIDKLYQLLLNRAADVDGEKFWSGKLADGATRSDVARGISDSQENNTQLINDDYFHYLGRGADAKGLAYWLGQFADGKTNEDVIAGFTESDEYYNKHTG